MNKSKMKWMVGAAVIIVAAGFWFYWNSTTFAAVGNLNIYTGTTQVARGSAQFSGSIGTEIGASDVITVSADGRASIIFKDGTTVRLGAGSIFSVHDVIYDHGKIKSAVLDLSSGKAWSNVEPLAAGGTYEVETPTVVATVRGTIFDVWYASGTSEVHVSNHAVNVALRADPASAKVVEEGNALVVNDQTASTDFAKGPEPFAPTDDWSKFNEGEDVKVQASGVTAPAMVETNVGNPVVSAPASQAVAVVPKSFSIAAKSSLNNLIEGNTVAFTATVTMSDGSKKDVTSAASWQVLGSIGTISRSGVFTAALGASAAEFGQATGAVVATWTDRSTGKAFLDKTAVFSVGASITPVTGPLQG